MAEINNIFGSVNLGDVFAGKDSKPLLYTFSKYFNDDTPSSRLRAVEFGKSLFEFFAPRGTEVPSDPATLLVATRTLFTVGFADSEITDEAFVRFLIHKFTKSNALVTVDMCFDLMSSETYKNFGSHGSDKKLKKNFETWVCDKSLLSKCDSITTYDAVEYESDLRKTIDLLPIDDADKAKRKKIIDDKVDAFKKEYVDHNDKDALKKLKKIANDNQTEYSERLKDVYSVLCGGNADGYRNFCDSILLGSGANSRSEVLTQQGVVTNQILSNVAKINKWKEEDVLIKFPVEERAEEFEKEAQNHLDKIFNPQPKKFSCGLDIIKTFGVTLGGATAISTLTTMVPVLGSVVTPIMLGTSVIKAGLDAYRAGRDAKLKKGLSNKDATLIAVKTGVAALAKLTPIVVSMTLGTKARAVGASVVFAKSLFNDMERRAKEQNAELQRAKPHGFKEHLKHLGEIGRTIGFKGFRKSAAYAVGKGAAVFAGGTLGNFVGYHAGNYASDKLHTFASSNFSSKLMTGVKNIFNPQNAVNDNQVDLKTQEINSDVNNDDIVKKIESSKTITSQSSDEYESRFQIVDNNTSSQLSYDSVQKLENIGDVELTQNARATVHAGTHRQYVDGVQQDWYTTSQEQTALETLRDAGVRDAEGVLRKLGSASRLLGNDYQKTLDNLCDGKISDGDVKQIFSALDNINAEGGLRNSIIQTPAGAENYRVADISLKSVVVEEPVVLDDPNYSVEKLKFFKVPSGAENYRVADFETELNTDYHDEPVVLDAPGYESEKLKTFKVPLRANAYHVSVDDDFVQKTNTTINTKEEMIPVPDSAKSYVHADLISNTEEFELSEPFSGHTNEIPMLSDYQLTRLRVENLRSTGFELEEAGQYLSSFTQSEIDDMYHHLNADEVAMVKNILNKTQPESVEL